MPTAEKTAGVITDITDQGNARGTKGYARPVNLLRNSTINLAGG
jgi:hypothetical protein